MSDGFFFSVQDKVPRVSDADFYDTPVPLPTLRTLFSGTEFSHLPKLRVLTLSRNSLSSESVMSICTGENERFILRIFHSVIGVY